MPKAAGKTRKSSKRAASAKRPAKKPVDLAAIRQQITNIVGNDAVAMVETTIEEAGKGHFQAMKCLFEMIGLYPSPGEEEPGVEDDSLAKALLHRLGPDPQSSDPDAVTKDSIAPPAVAEDAVK